MINSKDLRREIDDYEGSVACPIPSDRHDGEFYIFNLGCFDCQDMIKEILFQHSQRRFAVRVNVYTGDGCGCHLVVFDEALCASLGIFDSYEQRDFKFIAEAISHMEEQFATLREIFDVGKDEFFIQIEF